ncbi:Transcription factor bHLH95 [Linum perenne]
MELMIKSRNSSSNSLVALDEEESKVEVGKKRSSKAASDDIDNEGDQSEQQVHIWTERERRKRMRSMFTNLHTLLPHLPSKFIKADKSSIVDEAITYIKTLQQTLQTLEKQKLEKSQGLGQLDSEHSAVSVMTTTQLAREAFLASQGPTKLSTLTTMMNTPSISPVLPAAAACGFQTWFSPNVVLNMCGDDAHICVCSVKKKGLLTTIIHILSKHSLDVVSAHISSHHHSCTYMIHVHGGGSCSQFPESLSVEDTFKLAAGELNLWLLSF